MAGLVVMHVSDGEGDVARALSAAALITTQEPMRVQVIINGPAITGVGPEAAAIEIPEGVGVFACERALRGQGLSAEDVADGVQTVPSAVIALARAQHEGAAYVRI